MTGFDRGQNHFDQQLSRLPAQAILYFNENQKDKGNQLLTQIIDLALKNKKRHQVSLELAKSRIQQFTFLIGGLSLSVLVYGLYFASREKSLAKAREREATAVAAVTALVKALEARDPYTKGHSARVACLSHCLAKQLGYTDQEAEQIKLSAIMHDIGKIGIPDEVLLKPGKLTPEEYRVIQRHPALGAQILAHAESLKSIVPAVLHHHEQLNGKGYPDGLSGNEIPLSAQLISIADAYDAMTSTRPYRRSLSREIALAELRAGIGERWSGKLVETFAQMWLHCLHLPAQLDEEGA